MTDTTLTPIQQRTQDQLTEASRLLDEGKAQEALDVLFKVTPSTDEHCRMFNRAMSRCGDLLEA